MSVFSMIRRGRQAAKDHRAEQAKKEKSEAEKPPYKHVPRHAATDAMSGGPAGWRENDRVRILEQNRRRSALTASGFNMSGVITPVHPGMSHVHRGLSQVSYPASCAGPVVQLPRNYSYSSMPSGWTPHGREMGYSPVDMGSILLKGKEVERKLDSSRSSWSSSGVSARRVQLPPVGTYGSRDASSSPVESSDNSTSSRDDLEIKLVVRHGIQVLPSASSTRPNRPTSESESMYRLHPGRSRRTSDPNQSAGTSRSLAPRTTPLAAGITPVPALPLMQFGTAIATPEVFSSAASIASSVTMIPVASSASLAAKDAPAVGTPIVLKVEEEVAMPQQADLVTAESSGDENTMATKIAAEVTMTSIDVSDSPTKKGQLIMEGREDGQTPMNMNVQYL